jgi:repressor LexA
MEWETSQEKAKEVGSRIKQRRRMLGLTQTELAEKLGYTDRSSISRIEKGNADIPQSRMAAFADALQTTPAFLLGWNDPVAKKGANTLEVLTYQFHSGENSIEYEDVGGDMYDGETHHIYVCADKAMSPTIKPGDKMIVSKQTTPRDKDVVLLSKSYGPMTVRRYRESGKGFISLVADNIDLSTEIFGDMDEMEAVYDIAGIVLEIRRTHI